MNTTNFNDMVLKGLRSKRKSRKTRTFPKREYCPSCDRQMDGTEIDKYCFECSIPS